MEHVMCTLCGAGQPQELCRVPEDRYLKALDMVPSISVKVMRMRCGHIYGDPQLDKEEIDRLYRYVCRSSALGYTGDAAASAGLRWKRAKSQRDHAWLTRRRPRTASGMALEIGCAEGLFLSRLATEGWRVVGIEPTLEYAAHARDTFDLEVLETPFEEVDDALAVIQRAAALSRADLAGRVVLLHCVSSYPTAPPDANLLVIRRLRDRFGVPVGYSDHTLGPLACIAAVALGACVVEKHFTLQKEGRTLRDHQLSADPTDLASLVAAIGSVDTMLGSGAKTLPACERESLNSARRSVAARVDIEAGRMITVEQLTCLRPGGGLPPASLPAVVGKTCAVEIPEGHQIPVSVLSSS
jgi:hypothetical protein